jgi:hypothetical protein
LQAGPCKQAGRKAKSRQEGGQAEKYPEIGRQEEGGRQAGTYTRRQRWQAEECRGRYMQRQAGRRHAKAGNQKSRGRQVASRQSCRKGGRGSGRQLKGRQSLTSMHGYI